jgi:hypothetical protein
MAGRATSAYSLCAPAPHGSLSGFFQAAIEAPIAGAGEAAMGAVRSVALRRVTSSASVMVLAGAVLLAATPPATVNYQGVLRDAADKPLSGSYDIVLRFMDAASAGNEILVDQHTAATANAVTVSTGLFNVALGSGTVGDGSGPGTYTSLDAVFRDYTSVWLEVTVGGETLSPRTPIQSAPYSLNATHLAGRPASDFLDTSSTPQEKDGELLVVSGIGPGATGLALDAESLGDAVYAYSYNEHGIVAESTNGAGGQFTGAFRGVTAQCTGYPCQGVLATGSTGIFAEGSVAGGHFDNSSSGPDVDIATPNVGITTTGGDYGGYFQTSKANSIGLYASAIHYGGSFNGTTGLYAAGSDTGVTGTGGNYGGYLTATGSGSSGLYANGAHTGVVATGASRGGYFTDAAGNNATLAGGGMGISASSVGVDGSYFSNGAPYFSYTRIPHGDEGIDAYGSAYGGVFHQFQNSNYAYVSYSSYKILGTGAVSFVQNHPDDSSKVIVYVAPEGDEAAVYTRGSGKLVNGEARVALGETFALVANPDIGLTATATPRGEPIPLAVSEVSPGEVVVRGPAGSNAEFDYMVWGLRIGFEEQSIVQPKKDESKIPSMHDHEKFFQDEPGLRKYTALARFEGVEEKVHGRKSVDHARADRLRDAIGVFPYRAPEGLAHEPGRRPDVPAAQPASTAGGNGSDATAAVAPSLPEAPAGRAVSGVTGEPAGPVVVPADGDGAVHAIAADLDRFAAEGVIEAGDVVSLTPAAPGSVTRSTGTADALVIGCAQPGSNGSGVVVATSHVALCRADATLGEIGVGDRLSPSRVPGLAMRFEPEVAGSMLLGRAIDPLPSGVGLIRVLLGGR